MAQIEFKVRDRAVRSYLDRLASRTGTGRAALLRRIGVYASEVAKQSFREGADPGTGEPWKPLSEKYAAWKRRKGKSSTPLTLSGRLRRSIHHLITGKHKVAIGTDTQYGRHHQFGGRVPKRRFLGLSKTDEKEIEEIAARWLRGRRG